VKMTVIFPDDLDKEIRDFQHKNRISSFTQAVVLLLTMYFRKKDKA